jgi:TorA maturation chaperone TorD
MLRSLLSKQAVRNGILMGELVANPAESQAISEEDALRAGLYDFLAVLLSAPASQATIDRAKALTGDTSELGNAIKALSRVASLATTTSTRREFNKLFIGVGRGELLPYGSYYMAGFLNEKPLANLRQDLLALGIERAPNVFEPEDNIASLCEMMARLIDGKIGNQVSLDRQRQFFDRHIAPWARHFFADLEGARNSLFYAPVGAIGRTFMEIEKEAFRLAA